MEKGQPAVAVIIVGTNERKWIPTAIATLLASEFTGRLELIYVDNHSQDKSVEMVQRRFPSVHIVENLCNRGFSGANNQGIRKARALNVDYIFFVNPDTATPKGLIRSCIEFMQQHDDFGAIGPLQTRYGEELEKPSPSLNTWSEEALEIGEGHPFDIHFPGYRLVEQPVIKSPKIDHILEHAYVQGAALFVRNNVLEGSDWFDTTYHTFYEEVDLCRRMRWLGYRVGLLTNAFIQHLGGGSTAETHYKRKLMLRNKYYYVMTDPTWSLHQISTLFKRWMSYDFRHLWPHQMSLIGSSFLWLLFHLPKALAQRSKYRKLSKRRFLKIIPVASYE